MAGPAPLSEFQKRWGSPTDRGEDAVTPALPRDFLADLFSAAVRAADPLSGIIRHLPQRPKGRTVVIGAGKGAAQMARALESVWKGPLEGVVVTRYGYGCETAHIRIIEAAHPVPDAAGLAAARQLVETISSLGPDDLVIALICGGGSALLPAPPEGLTLQDEIDVNEALLASGAPIAAMNVVRKHLSTIKGGRLAAQTGARVVSLIVSDIPGDNPAHVASGPTVPDASTRHDALDVIAQYDLRLPQAAIDHLNSPAADAPRPDDPVFARHEHHIIASAAVSLEAAAELARSHGIPATILSDSIEGEARDVALVHAAIAREVSSRNRPFAKPVVILSGGETTVTLRARGGRGGRNSEFALALSLAIDGIDGIHGLAADTDGIDGSQNNAGAFFDGATIKRLRAAELDPRRLLDGNDSYSGFDRIGDLFQTGPTGTNVNDFRAILIV
jgi:glycerate 2-kinase